MKRFRINSATSIVLIMLCIMYFITYLDRVNVSTAAAGFGKEFGLSHVQIGLVFSAFAYPYLVFQIIGGWVSDRFGAKKTLNQFVRYAENAQNRTRQLMRLSVVGVIASVCLIVAACGGGGGIEQSPDKVAEENGVVQGTILTSGVVRFLGVPYASPPVGNLRWVEPQPAENWQGVRSAQLKPSACAKLNYTYPSSNVPQPTSEDCLYLNIWLPPTSSGNGKKPVFVWFYGNGHSASEPVSDGEQLAKKGIIVVEPQYRQNVFGWLALPELSASSSGHSSGNYGVLDEIAALKWVQRNIGSFGGDQTRVTMAGHSLGALSTSVLQQSALAKGLFQRYMAMSGTDLTKIVYAQGKCESLGSVFENNANVTSVAALRALSTAQILAIPTSNAGGFGAPCVDGYVLADTPQQIFQAGTQNDVPIFMGHDSGENNTTGIINASAVTNVSTYLSTLQASFGTNYSAVLGFFPVTTDASALTQAVSLNTEQGSGVQVALYMGYQSLKGKSTQYQFVFDRGTPANAYSLHGNDVGYWFGNLTASTERGGYPYTTSSDYNLSNTMMDALVAFATTGNPNTAALTVPIYLSTNDKFINLNVTSNTVENLGPAIPWFIANNYLP